MSSNNLMTDIWGPHLWFSLHCITFGYPDNPTNEDKSNYRNFFISLSNVLPCNKCKESYKKFISTGITVLTEKTFENRTSLTKWLYLLHQTVNEKIGIDYGVTYQDILDKYNKFQSNCLDNYEDKCVRTSHIDTYKYADYSDCPLIPRSVAVNFIKYAKMRGISDTDLYLIIDYCKTDYEYAECVKNKMTNDAWIQRNIECSEIIRFMRKNNINSLENEPEWNKLPTVFELKLIMRFCSNLNTKKLLKIIKLLEEKQWI